MGLLLPCTEATAQQAFPPSVTIGDRLRGTLRDGRRFDGYVTSHDSLNIVVRRYRASPLINVPLDSLRSYEFGLRPQRGHGARRGALIGAGFTLLASGISIYYDSRPNDNTIGSSLYVIPLSLGFPILGAGLGAVVAPTRWQPQVRMAGASRARNVNLGLSFSF